MGPVSKELARRFTKWSGRFRQGTETLPSVKDDASMNRRDFLTAVGSATMTGTGLCGGSSVTEPEPAVRYRVIDAHVHVFNTWHKLPTHFDGVPRTSATVENTVAALDAGGVEKAFLITYTSLDIGRGMPPGVDPVKSLPVYS